jgi:hypothetical protein
MTAAGAGDLNRIKGLKDEKNILISFNPVDL